MAEKFKCPVCGQHEFEEFGDHDLCPVCEWWNDSVQYHHPDFEGGHNKMSLNQAKEAYKNGQPVL